jgi:hypothetical protein
MPNASCGCKKENFRWVSVDTFWSSSHHLNVFNYVRNSKMHSLSLLRNFCLPSHLLSKHHLPIIAVNHFNSWQKFLWMKYNSNLLCQRFAGICLHKIWHTIWMSEYY